MGTRQRVRIDPVDKRPTPRPSRPRIIKPTAPSILDAVLDQNVFRPFFPDLRSWTAWLAFLAATFGLAMTDEQLAIYRQCTGRQEPPTDVAKEVWLIIGRRGGKSRAISLVACWLSAFFDYTPYLAAGEVGVVQVLAADRRQARVILRFIKAFLSETPMLARMIVTEPQEGVTLSNRIAIEVTTASFKSVRGRTVVAALLDEVAFWQSEDSANPDAEVLAAIKPSMATIPNSMLLAASSPYAKRGILFDAHKKHFGKERDPVLVWQSPTRVMNPTVDQSIIDEAMEADPSNCLAEYMAEFRSDIAQYLSLDVISACISDGVHERGRETGKSYFAFADPAGGSGKDSFTLAIGHKDKATGLSVIDAIRETKPPFSPEAVVEEYATLLKSYNIKKVTGDRYAGEWPRERFKVHGIIYDPAARAKRDLYQDALPLINSKRVDLLDHPKMVQQFIGLEVRTSRSKPVIDHAPNAHDDIANVVAGLLVSIGVKKYAYDETMKWASDGPDYDERWRAGRLHLHMNGGVFR